MFGYNFRVTKHSSPQTSSNAASQHRISKTPPTPSVSRKIKPG